MALLAVMTSSSIYADQNAGYPPYQQEQPGFFHRASDKVGGFFKRLFKSEEQVQPPTPAPPRSYRSSSRGGLRYNLDQPPDEARGSGVLTPVKELPQADTSVRNSNANRSKSKNSSSPEIRPVAPLDEHATKQRSQKTIIRDTPPATTSSGSSSREPTITYKKPEPESSNNSSSQNILYSAGDGKKNNSRPVDEPAIRPSPEPTPPPQKSAPENTGVLTGSKTSKPGRVKSPYAPYSELDVTGLPSGSLALDPTTQKVFRVP